MMNKFYKDYVLANPCALNDEDIDKLVSHCKQQIMLGYEFNDKKHKEEHETTLKIINEYERLKQENKELHNKIDKAIKITHKILMNNADNRMICSKEEEEYFDWLDKEMLEQEKILKDGDVDE